MLEHLAWHVVHASAPEESREAATQILQGKARWSLWHPTYIRRIVAPPAPSTAADEEGRREATPPPPPGDRWRAAGTPTRPGTKVGMPPAGPSQRASPHTGTRWGQGRRTP